MADARKRTVTAILEGTSEDRGAVRLDALQQFIQQWLAALTAIDKEITGDTGRTTKYRITELSYASPVRIGIEARPEKGKKDYGEKVMRRFSSVVGAVSKGEEPDGVQTATLEAMRGLSATFTKGAVKRIEFKGEEQDTVVDDEFEKHLSSLLGNVYSTFGTFRGRLQAFNIHDKPKFFIYPLAGPARIACVYQRAQFPNIGAIVDREPMVDVYGRMRYRGDSPHPFEIEIEKITELPEESTLPSFGVLRKVTEAHNGAAYHEPA